MLNKLFKLFGYELVKCQSLKDINFDKEIIPVKEEVVKPILKKRKTSITIFFSDGNNLSWDYSCNSDDKRFPYADLYTWYFSRTTPLFMFEHNRGETIFRREDIVRIERSKNIIVDKD